MSRTFAIIQRLRQGPNSCKLIGNNSGYERRSLSLSSTPQASKNDEPKAKISNGNTRTGAKTKVWNDAASVMAVAPMNNSEPYSLGYLMVERSGTGRVMPGNWVFPGGNTDKMDSDLRWVTLFKGVQNIDIVQERIIQEGAKIPEIYLTDDDNLIPKEISLRITAVREMFEEAGILLCKPRKVDPTKHLHNGMLHYEFLELKDKTVLQDWQKKVRKNSAAFVDLCKELDCVPDVHALHDWNNWLTPTVFKSKSRFDTIFYMLIIPKMPRVVIDGNEAVKARWTSPSSILEDHAKGQARLLLPQLYEMTRLKSLPTIGDLQQRLKVRQRLGIERYFPVVRKAKDGSIFILPGDDLYPTTPDYVGTEPPVQEIDSTVAQLKETSKSFHRGIINSDGVIQRFEINVERFGNIY